MRKRGRSLGLEDVKRGLGLAWVTDRPTAMALLETDGDEYVAAPALSASNAAIIVRRNGRVVAVPRDYWCYGDRAFAVWQTIAPSKGSQASRYKYRKARRTGKSLEPRLRVVVLVIEVHPSLTASERGSRVAASFMLRKRFTCSSAGWCAVRCRAQLRRA